MPNYICDTCGIQFKESAEPLLHCPISGSVVDSIIEKVAPLNFDRVYSHFPGLVIDSDAKNAVQRKFLFNWQV